MCSPRKDRKQHLKTTYEKHLENDDVKATYATAKLHAGWKATTTPISFQIEGEKITNPQEMANIQMEAFKAKTKKLIDQLPPPVVDPLATLKEALHKWEGKDTREVFSLKNITNMKTLEIINKLGYSGSMAHDTLDTMAIKHGAQHLYKPITHLINLSINQSKFQPPGR